MTDEQLERRLRHWYRSEIPADETAPIALQSRVAIIPRASASPRRYATRRGVTLLAAAALTTAIVGGALVAGSGIVKLPSVVPPSVARSADPSVEPSAELPSVAPSVAPASRGLIAYVKFVPLDAVGGDCERGSTGWWAADQRPTGCSRIWVSNTDGTNPHELLPDHHGYQTPLSWSPDGTRLLLEDAAGLSLADASGTVVQSLSFEVLCPIGCPTVWGYEFSPDGATIAFARPLVTTPEESVIALVDVATGHVTELASTASDRNDAPHWSPDGTRLTFARQQVGPSRATLFMVNVDGSNLHQYVPLNLYAIEPRWSPDGSLIAFLGQRTPDGKTPNIYVVHPDGSGFRRLTSDNASIRPEWTADGRLVFAHGIGDPSAPTGFELWIIDADGANKAKLPVDDVAQLTAAHCMACAWVRDPDSEIPITEFMINAHWQPTP
jgi:dipeptidyl aminopeptidase/acylaminoacyl peptidase